MNYIFEGMKIKPGLEIFVLRTLTNENGVTLQFSKLHGCSISNFLEPTFQQNGYVHSCNINMKEVTILQYLSTLRENNQ